MALPDIDPRPATTAPEGRSQVLTFALFVPLVVLLVVAATTWRAERRYRAVTDRVLHDYASIAAWQYARAADTALHSAAMAAFAPVAKGHQRTGPSAPLLPAATLLEDMPDQSSVIRDSARFAFTYDSESDHLSIAGGPTDDGTRAMVQARLRRLFREGAHSHEPHRVLFESAGERSHAILLSTLSLPDRPMRATYGFVADPALLAPQFRGVIGTANLVPATSATIAVSPADFAIRITDRHGNVVFATPTPIDDNAATDTVNLQSGELRTTVGLSPRLADALLVGGAPGSQLPLLAVLIVLAAALAALGVAQDRRNRELARLRSRFVANVSHELRTPLAQISMFAETLQLSRERNETERRRFASIIHAEARRLTNLVESVLRFSRQENGATNVHLEPADVTWELSHAVEAFAPIAEAAQASVTLRAAETWAHVDRAALRQIVLNLLDNAVKHGGANARVEITTRQQGSEAHVVVDDAGSGIPHEWRERVFHPFVRVDGRAGTGAGIGLAVVHDLVTAHGGRVWVEDSPQGGARFVVMLRAAEPRVSSSPSRPALAGA